MPTKMLTQIFSIVATGKAGVCLIAIVFSSIGLSDRVLAQRPASDTFDRSVAYGNGFQLLNQELERNRERFIELNNRVDSVSLRLEEATRDSQFINNVTFQTNLQSIHVYIRELDLQRSLDSLWRSPTLDRTGLTARSGVSSELSYSRIHSFNLQQQIAQLDAAGRFAAERWYKLLIQYQTAIDQINVCFKEEKRLMGAYIALSDQNATRCQFELNAALRILNAAPDENYGARLAKGITQLRLGRTDEATKQFDSLLHLPIPYSTIALAARIESSALTVGGKLTRDEQRMLTGVTDPTVQFFLARSAAIQENFSESLKLCDRLQQVKTHQMDALVLASILNSHPANSQSRISKACEQAKLARDLTGGRDWYATIALALAHAANQEPDRAKSLADRAIELSIGDMRKRCIEIRNALDVGQPVKWKF